MPAFITPSRALSLIALGAIIIVGIVFRQLARRRRFGDSYNTYIDKVKLRQPMDRNEYGQKVRWLVEEKDHGEDSSEEGT